MGLYNLTLFYPKVEYYYEIISSELLSKASK